MKLLEKRAGLFFFSWLFVLLFITSYPKPELGLPSNLPWDKLIHFCLYAPFAFLGLYFSTKLERGRRAFLIFLLLWPLLDELHQIPIPGRGASIMDLVADYVGMAVGGILFLKRI